MAETEAVGHTKAGRGETRGWEAVRTRSVAGECTLARCGWCHQYGPWPALANGPTLEVGVARAPQCHKWHGDGDLAPRAQRPGGPEAQRDAAIGESETVTRQQQQRRDVRREQRNGTTAVAAWQ